jgi:2'-5' RNA ligase
MLGVVSLLDEENSSFIRGLWEELTREFGFSAMTADSSPHVSFHVAEQYDRAKVEERAKSLARSLPPFATKTAGIGVFPGAEQVVFLPVVRTPRLTVVHRAVLDEIKGLHSGDAGLYTPDEWVPHVTLGRWEASKNVAGDAVRYLVGRDLVRDLLIDNIALLEEGNETRHLHFVYKLTS